MVGHMIYGTPNSVSWLIHARYSGLPPSMGLADRHRRCCAPAHRGHWTVPGVRTGVSGTCAFRASSGETTSGMNKSADVVPVASARATSSSPVDDARAARPQNGSREGDQCPAPPGRAGFRFARLRVDCPGGEADVPSQMTRVSGGRCRRISH